MATYTSQQPEIQQSLISYLQNPDNWEGGIPLITDFTPGSVAFTLLAAFSVAVDALGMQIFMTRQAAYISTATGDDLDAKVADFGLTRNEAIPASGTFTFTKNNAAAANIDIPAGSLISTIATSSETAVTYATNVDAMLPIGETSVEVECTCQVSGSGGNISAGSNLLIASMIPGIDGVTLEESITNGDDDETDDALRARGLAAFQALAHGTIASYKNIVMSVSGISDAIVVPLGRGPGTVDIYILGPDNSLPSEETQEAAQAAIDAQKVATDDVDVLVPSSTTVNVTFSVHLAVGFDPDATAEAVQDAVEAYIGTLGIGASATEGTIYASKLVAAALTVSGVLNATTTYVDTEIDPSEAPESGTITINIV